jgi:hypothetical protein
MKNVTLALLLAAAFGSAHATEIYKWVAANGVTQYTSALPQDAQARPQRFIPRGNSSAYPGTAYARDTYPDPAVTAQPGYTAPSPRASLYPPLPQTSNREQRLAAYRASQECFEQYRNANASMKAEAFSVCREMKDPNGEQVR